MRLKMSKTARRELLEALKCEYSRSSKVQKMALLEGLVRATAYNRKHAIKLLNSGSSPSKLRKHQRKPKYSTGDFKALKFVWLASNRICSKRLQPFLESFVDSLVRHGHLSISKAIKHRLLSMSASTIDRLLKEDRKKLARGRSTTRPGSLLKRHIEVRTFSDWTNSRPGFFEADCVAHCGTSIKGSFLSTLTLTDIHTGWTECKALPNKSESAVAAALSEIAGQLPFPVRGFDSDNGTEFINSKILEWCAERKVTFTRSREYRKNDQAHVEEKNGSIVRKYVGYDRFEGKASLKILAKLHSLTRLYVNFFQPSMKIVGKEKDGGKVTKVYEQAKTPCQRLLESDIPETVKKVLRRQSKQFDPITLLKEIEETQIKLWRTSTTINTSDIAQGSILQLLQDEPGKPCESLIEKLANHRNDLRVRKKKPKVSNIPKTSEKPEGIRKLRTYIRSLKPGTTFKLKTIEHLLPRWKLHTYISRMTKQRELIRIGWGTYKVPTISPIRMKTTD